jgi:energy-coupling factor transporter ATP-binding protein EcfA2
MALNFDKVGRPLAVIEGGTKHKNKTVSISTNEAEEEEITKSFRKIDLADDQKFQQIPNANTERQIIYITGASGSGKSTYIAKYCKQYKKAFPDNEIYVFSALNEDESLDVIKPKRIIIDERMISDPLGVDDFENSMVIFDDIDVIGDKKLRESVYQLLNALLETGRHTKSSICISNHLPTAGRDTRRVLNEAHSVIWFPHSGSGVGTKRLLCDYLGLDKDLNKKLKKMKTRWACYFKNYPSICMTERNMWLLADDDE